MKWLWIVLLVGCSSSNDPVATDASVDSMTETNASETNGDECPTPETVTALGDTCVSYGPGSPCDACGLPPYGYVCTNGRPDVAGCVRVRPESAIAGATYCCTELACVRAPLLDSKCGGGKKMVQCPEDSMGMLLAQPGVGCEKATEPPPYQWFCCP